jgi:hypothetical protein
MFDSLSDRMKQDEKNESSTSERLLRWGLVAVASVCLFGGLYYGVSMLE